METSSFVLSARQMIGMVVLVALLVMGTTLATTARFAGAVEPGVPVVYVATGGNFPDALAGGVLASLTGGPLLLVNRASIPPATDLELKRLEPQRIVIFGGVGVVSPEVEAALSGYTNGPVERIAGTDRFDTAAEIAKAMPTAPYAGAGHDHGLRRTNVSSLPLQSSYSTRSNLSLSLDDPCGDGATRWNLFVTAHASAHALNTTTDIDLTIALDSTQENPQALARATILPGGAGVQVYQSLALQAQFTEVEPGARTVRLLARKSENPAAAQLTRGRMHLMAMGYHCD